MSLSSSGPFDHINSVGFYALACWPLKSGWTERPKNGWGDCAHCSKRRWPKALRPLCLWPDHIRYIRLWTCHAQALNGGPVLLHYQLFLVFLVAFVSMHIQWDSSFPPIPLSSHNQMLTDRKVVKQQSNSIDVNKWQAQQCLWWQVLRETRLIYTIPHRVIKIDVRMVGDCKMELDEQLHRELDMDAWHGMDEPMPITLLRCK